MARSLVMSPETLKDVNDSQSPRLAIPEDAVQKGAGDSASYTWMEDLVVTDSKIVDDPKKNGRWVWQVTFTVPKDSPWPKNAGRSVSFWYRTHPDAVNDSSHGDRMMTVISMARLKGILAAAGQPVEPGTDIAPFFDGNGPAAPALVVGSRIVAKFRDKPDEDKDGNPTRKQEPVLFLTRADAGLA